jgi:hypothetical protein
MAMKVELGASLGARSNPGEDIGMIKLAQLPLKAVNIFQKTPVPRLRYQCPPKITLTLKYVNRGIKDLQIRVNPCSLLMPPMPISVPHFSPPAKRSISLSFLSPSPSKARLGIQLDTLVF